MTVAERGEHDGELREVASQSRLDTDEPEITLSVRTGRINADLTTGTDGTSVAPLLANEGLASPGVKLHGAGFIIPRQNARNLGLGARDGLDAHFREYRNGRDLLGNSRNAMVIDFHGLDEATVRQRFPEAYDHILREVKPERDANPRATYRNSWWIFGEPRREMRPAMAGLNRYIATPVTAKHRIFQFLEGSVLPDDALIAIADQGAETLGVLQSSLHRHWAVASSGTLENRERYNKSNAFDPFPFPDFTPEQRATIAELAEELDATRKAALAETDKLTMTELYNLRAKLKSGEPMSEAEQRRATKARAAIIDRLHEQIDQAVADAYGWGEEWRAGALGPSEIVARLVALNHERGAEEADGKVRWLRPDYQVPKFGKQK